MMRGWLARVVGEKPSSVLATRLVLALGPPFAVYGNYPVSLFIC